MNFCDYHDFHCLKKNYPIKTAMVFISYIIRKNKHKMQINANYLFGDLSTKTF